MKIEKFSPAINFSAGSGYIPGLDGLRALSILMVFVSHVGFGKFVPGGLGVTIFFFISGFLITRLLAGEQNKSNGDINLKLFYIRRFLRLMPALYFFILAVTFLVIPWGGKPMGIHIVAALLYLSNYYDLLANNNMPIRVVPWGHLWSLAIEEHFYLIFPLALSIFGRTKESRLLFVATAIVVSMIWRYYAYSYFHFGSEYTFSSSDCRFESIAWGCLLAVSMDLVGESGRGLMKFIGWQYVALGLGLICFSLLFRNDDFRATFRYTVQGIALFVIVINLYGFSGMRLLLRLLEAKVLKFIGRLSYSLYLWHMPIIWIFMKSENTDFSGPTRLSVGAMLISATLTFGAALFSYYFIERPFFKLRKRFGGHPC